MTPLLELNAVCECSKDVVAREIEGEILIIPLVAGIGDDEDELFALNETGQSIWQKLDGIRTLKNVAVMLADEFNAPLEDIERDVIGFASQLSQRGIIIIRE